MERSDSCSSVKNKSFTNSCMSDECMSLCNWASDAVRYRKIMIKIVTKYEQCVKEKVCCRRWRSARSGFLVEYLSRNLRK